MYSHIVSWELACVESETATHFRRGLETSEMAEPAVRIGRIKVRIRCYNEGFFRLLIYCRPAALGNTLHFSSKRMSDRDTLNPSLLFCRELKKLVESASEECFLTPKDTERSSYIFGGTHG